MTKLFLFVGGVMILIGGLSAQVDRSSEDLVGRGAYLVENVAMCGSCHTPRNQTGELDRLRWLKGAPIPVQSPFANRPWAFQAPAIAGLPGWNAEEAVTLLTTARRPGGQSPKAPMPSFRFTEEDARAVVAYLMSLR